MKKIYEFLLWNNCNNNCTFCHQRSHERKALDKILTPSEQVEALKACGVFLNEQFEKGNHILLVGGEIFDNLNVDVKKELRYLFMDISIKMIHSEIDLFYLNTNLLYNNTELLYDCLDILKAKQLLDRVKFTTSYDIEGRFSSVYAETTFVYNLNHLIKYYPELKIVVNVVLTKSVCDRIVNDTFGTDYLLTYLKTKNIQKSTIVDWINYFGVQVNTIPYIQLDYEKAPQMPSKSDIFSALLHIDSIFPGYLEQYANNIALKQEKRLYEYNKITKEFIYCSANLNECGHSINFTKCFNDSTDCFPCTIQRLLKYKA